MLQRLAFAGPKDAFSELGFGPGANLVYGASNTGKSLALKAIDFMLGSTRVLPDITERHKYDRVLLTLQLPASGQITLFRSIQGGPFTIVDGMADSIPDGVNRTLSAKHDPKNSENLSNLLLTELGLAGKQHRCVRHEARR
ncbi:MAG: hypothetical protein NW206_17740 [Hyphomonadaceae bacterium]|nr:hypothetical protein [Hyphomonadaceae bacterium]